MAIRKQELFNNQAITTAIICLCAVGCSPYVYKDEINGFSTGVDSLSSAYTSGITEANKANNDNLKQALVRDRSNVAYTEGCTPSCWEKSPPNVCTSKGTPKSCTVTVIGETPPSQSAIAQVAAENAPKCLVLKNYAKALAAITNSADQDALDSAQADLKVAVGALATKAGLPDGGSDLVVSIFNDVTAWGLDTRRYQVLKSTVTKAHPSVAVVGQACGQGLDALRADRGYALFQAGSALQQNLGHQTNPALYAERIDIVMGYASTLDQLRQSNPTGAANEMVVAHEKLRDALQDDNRQIEPVARAVGSFVEKASALRSAFGDTESTNATK